MKNVLIIALILLGFSACKDATVETYFVDNAEKEGYFALDLPASLIQMKEGISTEAKNTLSSIKKMNIIAMKKEGNDALYAVEHKKFKALQKNTTYEDLMRFKNAGTQFSVKVLGESNAVDQILVFADNKDMGFGVVRILGDKMNPAKIMQLKNEMGNIDIDGNQLSVLHNLLN